MTRFLVFLAAFLTFAAVATACDPSPCGAANAWASAFDTFEIPQPKSATSAARILRGHFSKAPLNEIYLHSETTGARAGGEFESILIDERTLATSLTDERGTEASFSMQGAVASAGLASALLAQAFPGGPSQIAGRKTIDIVNGREPILVSAWLMSSSLPGPWTLKGFAEKSSAGRVSYELHFATQPKAGSAGLDKESPPSTANLTLIGAFENAGYSLGDTKSIKDWQTFGADWIMNAMAGMAGGKNPSSPGKFETLGQLRAHLRDSLRREEEVGEADATRDLSGFWKHSCEVDYGLEIARLPNSLKYSISFCGPGGCAKPGEYRHNSYINKDRNYEIVSADELKVGSSTGWSLYKRCAAKAPQPGSSY